MENELVPAALSPMTRHVAANKQTFQFKSRKSFFLLKLMVKSQLIETNVGSGNLKAYSIKEGKLSWAVYPHKCVFETGIKKLLLVNRIDSSCNAWGCV